ncbi:MAG: tetratricopeptide repeat protein [Bacteroidetes bacterium]|nr:tetratricopeptide repeat protein [Bacteroidota bacterium]
MRYLVLVLFFLSSFLRAQTDSLQKALVKWESKPNYQKDTNYILNLNLLAEALWRKELLNEAAVYSKKALALAKPLNYLLGMSNAYNSTGIIYWYTGKYDSAIYSFESALPIFIKINNKKGVASSLNNIGMLHATKGDFPNALTYFFKALKINEENNNLNGQSGCCNNIGIIYKDLKEYDKALVYYYKSIAIDTKQKNTLGVSTTLINLGVIYDLKGMPDSAMGHYNRSLAMHKQLGATTGLSTLYINIAKIYLVKKEYEKAETNFKEAIENSKINDERSKAAEGYAQLGSMYVITNKLSLCLQNLQKAEALAKELDATLIKKEVAKAFSEYYKKTHNAALALKYMEEYVSLKDSLYSEDVRESALTTQLQYEFEKKQLIDSVKYEKINAKKDLELADQKVELAKERTIKYLLALGVVFLIAIALVALRAYNNKKAANREIFAQKELIENQKGLVEEKQKEILDSITYAKRLQNAILPSDKTLSKYLPRHFVFYKPKDIVAGDFYWAESINGTCFIAVADCTGHGVPGAMVSVVCHNALNRAVLEFGIKEPGKILDKTRELVEETFSKSDSDVKDGMDISLCSIKTNADRTVIVKWAGANNSLWYFSEAVFYEIKAHKQTIGKTENPSNFPTHEFQLKHGDSLYLYTDGFADQFGGPKGKKYKSKKLQETISELVSKPAAEQKAGLVTTFENWKGSLEQIDDVTVIGIIL